MNVLSAVSLIGLIILSLVFQVFCNGPLVALRKGGKRKFPTWIKPQLPTRANNRTDKMKVIVGGIAAGYGQFSHQALLTIDNMYLCGGSLIGNKWILTAGHCAYNRYDFHITLGSVFWRQYTETSRWTTRSNTSIVHEKYNPFLLQNDVALIKLTTSAPSNKFISAIALPIYSDVSKQYVGVEAIASGYGWNQNNGFMSDSLMWVTMPIISNAECKQSFGSKYVFESTICTSGTGSKSTCRGDSGGALIIEENGMKKMAGVVSFGARDCQSGSPQGYARVTTFLPWISEKTGIIITQ